MSTRIHETDNRQQHYDDWIEMRWPAIRPYVAQRWPDLDHSDLDVSDLTMEQLTALIQQQYGLADDIALRQIVDFVQEIGR